jgi:hypothetical protein
MKFELERLIRPTKDEIIQEVCRVAGLIKSGPLTRKAFDQQARFSSDMIVRKFGGWEAALRAVGLSHRYSGPAVTERMRSNKRHSEDELVAEMRRVADALGSDVLTMKEFNAHASVYAGSIERRFGSWKAALERAGLRQSPLSRRYSDEDYFENMLHVWTRWGRQPKLREMDEPPSVISSGAYEAKFGGWKHALAAFLAKVNTEDKVAPSPAHDATNGLVVPPQAKPGQGVAPRVRTIPLGLRYIVLSRDRFRCVRCGVSPATDAACQIHVDHIKPFSKGGATTKENLRTLCSQCNIGRGNKEETTSTI